MSKTKGQIESEICEAVIKFEKEYMGRGPLETKAYIIDDMVLVRLKNVLTPAEMKLASVTIARSKSSPFYSIRAVMAGFLDAHLF